MVSDRYEADVVLTCDDRGAIHAPGVSDGLNVGPLADAVWWYDVAGAVAAKDQDRGAVEQSAGHRHVAGLRPNQVS